jgi:hypothetical protein
MDNFFNEKDDRSYWVENLTQIVNPVLNNLACDTLKANMPFDYVLDKAGVRKKFIYLEAVGRVICGIAPWIEMENDDPKEEDKRLDLRSKILKGLKNLVNPNSKDYIDFSNGKQSLVDAAYLCQGLLRAPNEIWNNLDGDTQTNLVSELKKTRRYVPSETNWLLFASMVEITLFQFTKECKKHRLYKGVKKFLNSYYVGDGIYRDGQTFGMDYYNSYVIHPMLSDILISLKKYNLRYAFQLDRQIGRHTRFAEILERFISPEGTYPVIGRTITCRFGALNALSHAAFLGILPNSVSKAQVRSALTMVQKQQLKNQMTFDNDGWLQIGFSGKQFSLAEEYITRGSVYHCCTLFTPLGLPISDEFWNSPFEKWTNLKLWNGEEGIKDSSLKEGLGKNNLPIAILKKIYSKLNA